MKPKDENYSKSRRLKNQIKAVVTNPYNVIVLIAIVLLTYLIVLPLLDMISTSFTLAQRDARQAGGSAGDFTLYYWQRLLGSNLTYKLLVEPLLHSLLIGFCVSVCAILLGSVLAWLMVRTDLPFKPFFSLAVIIPYMIPSWCKSQAWLTMFKTPRIGGAPGFLASLGIHVPTGWLTAGRDYRGAIAPLLRIRLSAGFLGAQLHQFRAGGDGRDSGAPGKVTILRKITFPLVLPAMLSAVILTFSKAIGTFGVINYLGSKVNFVTLSSQLYMNSKSQNTSTAFGDGAHHDRNRLPVRLHQPEADWLAQILRDHRRQGRPLDANPSRRAQAGHHAPVDCVFRHRHHHPDPDPDSRVVYAEGRRLLVVQPYPSLLDRRPDPDHHGRPARHLQEC